MFGSGIFDLFNSEELECKRRTAGGFGSEYEDFTIQAIVKVRKGWRAERNGEIVEGGVTLHTRPHELKLNDYVKIGYDWYRVSGVSTGKDFTNGDEFDRVMLGAEDLESADGEVIEW